MGKHIQNIRRLWSNTRHASLEPSQIDIDKLSDRDTDAGRVTDMPPDIKTAHALAMQLAASPAIACNLDLVDSGYASSDTQPKHSPNTPGSQVENNNTHKSRSKIVIPPIPPRLSDLPRFSPLQPLSLEGYRTPGGGFRLPPTIVSRHMPLPIQNLPTLPPPSQRDSDQENMRAGSSRPSLLSVPSLSRLGKEGENPNLDSEMEEIEEGEEDDDEDVDNNNFLNVMDASGSSNNTTPGSPSGPSSSAVPPRSSDGVISNAEQGSVIQVSPVADASTKTPLAPSTSPIAAHPKAAPNITDRESQIGNSDSLSTPHALQRSVSHGSDKLLQHSDYFSLGSSASTNVPEHKPKEDERATVPTIITTAASRVSSPMLATPLPRGHEGRGRDINLVRAHPHPLPSSHDRDHDSDDDDSPNGTGISFLRPNTPPPPTDIHGHLTASITPVPPKSQSPQSRPSFYRQQSKSMANLNVSLLGSPAPPVSSGPNMTSVLSNSSTMPGLMPSISLKRRTSLPSLHPPPYNHSSPQAQTLDPIFARFKGKLPQPREEEGMEPLPCYELTVPILSALLPRKMEFTAPGEQANDRKWRRAWCVLQGTSFMVYEGEKGWGKVEGWFGRQLKDGSGAKSVNHKSSKGPSAWKSKRMDTGVDDESSPGDDPKFLAASSSVGSGSGSGSTASGSTSNMHLNTDSSSSVAGTGRASFSSFRSHYASSSRTSLSSTRASTSSLAPPPPPGMGGHRRSFSQALQRIKPKVIASRTKMRSSTDASRTSLDVTSAAIDGDATPPSTTLRERSSSCSSGSGLVSGAPTSPISPTMFDSPSSLGSYPDLSAITCRPLIKHYTLQRAESGVAIDYHKRPNVIRVRMEGEQFLLQMSDVKEVVEWIEGFQSAADVALDLDERVMPRGPVFPRRRRRRRRPNGNEPASTSATATTTTTTPTSS